jgi:hypothetical protein
MERALELDPLSLVIQAGLGRIVHSGRAPGLTFAPPTAGRSRDQGDGR